MNKEIDVEKIRGLLEEEIEFTKGCPDDCEHIDAHAHKAGLAQLLSLLPKPCETCGNHFVVMCETCQGSGCRECDSEGCIPCPDCQALHQNDTGQASAGEVEEFVAELINTWNEYLDIPLDEPSRKREGAEKVNNLIAQACTHLEALLKETEERYDKGWRDGSDAQDKADHEHIIKPLQAKFEQLEAKQKEKEE